MVYVQWIIIQTFKGRKLHFPVFHNTNETQGLMQWPELVILTTWEAEAGRRPARARE